MPPPPAIWDPEVRSQAHLTGRSTSCPLQVQLRPSQWCAPSIQLLPLQGHTGSIHKVPGKPCAALRKRPLPPATHHHHESQIAWQSSPPGATDRVDYLGGCPSSSYNQKAPFSLHETSQISEDDASFSLAFPTSEITQFLRRFHTGFFRSLPTWVPGILIECSPDVGLRWENG